jgi:hypothetical protein
LKELCGEAQVTLVGVGAGLGEYGVQAAHAVDVPPRARGRRVLPQGSGMTVVPAHVALVDGLDVVADRSVVATGVPGLGERGRQFEDLGDLATGVALVDQPQSLVVQVGVEVALLGQEPLEPVGAPGRPVVGGEQDVGAVSEELDRLREVARPDPGVADHRATQGQDVVQVVGGVLRHAQGAQLGEVEVHLRGGLGVRGELETEQHPVQPFLLPGPRDLQSRWQQTRQPARGGEAQPHPDEAQAIRESNVRARDVFAVTDGDAWAEKAFSGTFDSTLVRPAYPVVAGAPTRCSEVPRPLSRTPPTTASSCRRR